MNIFICDPGLCSESGHHFNWATSVAKEFKRLGLTVKIYAYGRAEIDVQAKTGAFAHFAHLTYQKHDTEWPGDEEQNWLIANESFRKDLERLNCEIGRPDAIVIVPAVTQNQLDGLAQWYETLRPERRPRLAVSLMFHPQWTPWGHRAIRGPEYYARAIDRLRPWIDQSVFLYTEIPEAKACYEELTAASIAVAPVPWEQVNRVVPHRPNGPTRFGYLGQARTERGFHLLPAALDICQRQGHSFDFIVQIDHDEADAITNRAAQALRLKSNVSPIIGPMDLEQYYRVLDSCDVVLLPYDPSMYRFRGSGLFAEAVAYAKPVVVSAGTAMENAANRGDCVARICEFSSPGLARAMCEVSSRRGELEAQAKIAARSWSEANNVSVFCRQLLALAEVHPPIVASANCRENEHLDGRGSERHTWTALRAGTCCMAVESPLSIQGSTRIEFIPKGLHSSRGLLVDARLVPDSDKGEAVALSLELNGHRLGSVAVNGRRRVHFIRGPFPFLRDGLPTTLKLGVTGGEEDKTSAVPQVYEIRFLQPAWRRRMFSRLVRSREKFMVPGAPEGSRF